MHLEKLENTFFELIQVAIGTRVCLSHSPTDEEWKGLYEAAKKQSLVGICFAGVQKLVAQQQEPPEMLYLTWMGMAAKIQQRNELVNRQCAELQAKLSADGFRSCILKGQGVAALYRLHDDDNETLRYDNLSNSSNNSNLSLLRQSGDIDIWVDGDRDKAMDWFRGHGAEVSYIDSGHAHADVFEDTEVEVHSRPSWMYSSKGDKAFTRYWMGCKNVQFGHRDERLGICYPTVEFNLVHSLLHINRHIFEEGIGFRQLMDYFFILMASTKEEQGRAMEVLTAMNLRRFARGIMYIEQKVFGLSDERMLCAADQKEGEFLLTDILAGGNFGKHDARTESYGLDERWKRGWFAIRHNMRYLMHYPSEVLAIPIWKVKHYIWRKKNGYI